MGQQRTRKRALLIGLICLGMVVLVALFSARGQGRLLFDDSTLRLTGLKVGATNTFRHGRMVDKLIGGMLPDGLIRRIIPPNGLSFWKLRLSRPATLSFGSPWTTILTTEFRLQPARGQSKLLGDSPLPLGQSHFDRNYRWTVQGDDEMRYLHDFRLQRLQDGLFAYISLSTFPRNARWLNFRLEECTPAGTVWKEIARFTVKNPAIGEIQPWSAPTVPTTKHVGDLEFTLGETVIQADPRHPNELWRWKARIPFQVRRKGVIETNWNADHFLFEDASGNAGELMGLSKAAAGEWLIYEPCPSLDPKLVWRITADFGLDSGWPPTNVCLVQVPVPLGSPMTTNCRGVPLQISISGDFLFVEMLTNRADLRLAFLGAKDQTGKDIGKWSGSWTEHRFPKQLDLPRPGSTIELTLAIDTNYRMEFYSKPPCVQSEPTIGNLARMLQPTGTNR